jgi:hypothetical protein
VKITPPLAIGLVAVMLAATAPSAFAEERKSVVQEQEILPTPQPGTTIPNPVQDPTAGAGSARRHGEVRHDRDRRDSTLQGAGDVTFPCSGTAPAPENRTVICPPGQTGAIIERRVYSAAPAPTCWVAGSWMQISNTCQTPCPAQPADDMQTRSCPVGMTGIITDRRTYSAAPAPTCWTPGPWVETSNTCANTCGPRPANETRAASCPAGWSGSITESRAYTAAAFPTCWTPGAWSQTSNTCCPPRPAPGNWTEACPVGQTGQIFWERPYVAAAAPTCWTPGEWVRTGDTCASAPPPTCPAQPADETDTQACPSGQTGSISVRRSYVAAAAPTCWTAGPWTTLSNTCATPPPPPPSCPEKPDDETRPATCPPGFTGTRVEGRTYVPVAAPTCWQPTAWATTVYNCEPAQAPDLGCGPGNAAPQWLGWLPDTRITSYQYGGACHSPEPWNPVAPPDLSGACTLGDERTFSCSDATNNYESNHFVNRCICN